MYGLDNQLDFLYALKVSIICGDQKRRVRVGSVLAAPSLPIFELDRERENIEAFAKDVKKARQYVNELRGKNGLSPIDWAAEAVDYREGLPERLRTFFPFEPALYAPRRAINAYLRALHRYIEDIQPLLELGPFLAVDKQNHEINGNVVRMYVSGIRQLWEESSKSSPRDEVT